MNPSKLMQTRLNQLANSGLNFDAPKEEMDLIIKIVARIMNKWGPNVVPKLLAMELTACHLNGTRLNLQALSDTDDQRLQADVFGIRRHIDRDTGKLKDGYLPVYQLPKAPWPDFAGTDIHHGDTIRHPSGQEGRVEWEPGEQDPGDQWYVIYTDGPEEGNISRLCLQIGDKGQAVVIHKSCVGAFGNWPRSRGC